MSIQDITLKITKNPLLKWTWYVFLIVINVYGLLVFLNMADAVRVNTVVNNLQFEANVSLRAVRAACNDVAKTNDREQINTCLANIQSKLSASSAYVMEFRYVAPGSPLSEIPQSIVQGLYYNFEPNATHVEDNIYYFVSEVRTPFRYWSPYHFNPALFNQFLHPTLRDHAYADGIL